MDKYNTKVRQRLVVICPSVLTLKRAQTQLIDIVDNTWNSVYLNQNVRRFLTYFLITTYFLLTWWCLNLTFLNVNLLNHKYWSSITEHYIFPEGYVRKKQQFKIMKYKKDILI